MKWVSIRSKSWNHQGCTFTMSLWQTCNYLVPRGQYLAKIEILGGKSPNLREGGKVFDTPISKNNLRTFFTYQTQFWKVALLVFGWKYPVNKEKICGFPRLPAHSFFFSVKPLCLIVKAWIYQLVVRQLSNGFLSCRQLLRQTDSTKLLTQYEADIAHIATHKRGLSMVNAKSLLELFCAGVDIALCGCKLNPIIVWNGCSYSRKCYIAFQHWSPSRYDKKSYRMKFFRCKSNWQINVMTYQVWKFVLVVFMPHIHKTRQIQVYWFFWAFWISF